MPDNNPTHALEITGEVSPEYAEILTPGALAFVEKLVREFGPARRGLLEKRVEDQARITAGEMPGFLPETADIRDGDWRVAPVPDDLMDRRVEITG
jgi:malate synthase